MKTKYQRLLNEITEICGTFRAGYADTIVKYQEYEDRGESILGNHLLHAITCHADRKMSAIKSLIDTFKAEVHGEKPD